MTFFPTLNSTLAKHPFMRDTFFDDLLRQQLTDFSSSTFKNDKFPYTDIFVDDTQLVFKFAIAGYNKDDIELSVDNNILTVSYDKIDDEPIDPSIKFIQRSISKRSFKKAFILGDQIDTDSIKATMENGILTITFTKTVKTIKKIEIN
jgi:HSP20 family molecular chaperone IbpA